MLVLITISLVAIGKTAEAQFDVLLSGGTLYDGSGRPGVAADVGITGDRVTAIGNLSDSDAAVTFDVTGLAVAPGFINVLSWATESLLHDGRSQSDIRQGVTLEVFGEGWSMGPLNPQMKKDEAEAQGDIKYDLAWTSLAEYLEHLVEKGVSCNVASFVGATTVRIHELGYENRPPSPDELERMKSLVRQAMRDGALGVASSLIYAPAFYADTVELTELCKAAAEYDGLYITHIRSEGNRLLEAVDEFLAICRNAGIRGEIYHLKAAGEKNWDKLDEVVAKLEQARAEGMEVTADIYNYTAGATGLNATMPPWVQEGGYNRWADRLRDPQIRARVAEEMRAQSDDWENLLLMSGSPDKVLLAGFKNENLKQLTGRTLAEVARRRGKSVEETAMDLVVEDGSRVETVFFMMSEENIRKKIRLPWVSFCSDAASLAPEGVFLLSQPHPRAYGSFARLLGKYVRDEKVIPLHTAIHKLTALPADNLRIKDRGMIKEGYFADVVVFDPATIQDNATYDRPHQYATGVKHVLVNGLAVLKDGEHTNARPGKIVWGPGKTQDR